MNKSTLVKILQINRIVRLARKKCLRLIDSGDMNALENFVTTMNSIMSYKDKIENIGTARSVLTVGKVIECKDRLREVVNKY